MIELNKETYLGDGVYVLCDGYSIVLSIEREGEKQSIFLEPGVLQNLDTFRRELARQFSAPQYAPKSGDDESRC